MKIKSVKIKDFKRFTDFEINNIPQSAKLVVLVGPNGSGKTSLFESFNYVYNQLRDWSCPYKNGHLGSSV